DLHPVVLADGGALVAAEGLEVDLLSFDLADGVDDRAVVFGPLERRVSGRPALVNLDAEETILRSAVTRLRGDRARLHLLVLFGERLQTGEAAEAKVECEVDRVDFWSVGILLACRFREEWRVTQSSRRLENLVPGCDANLPDDDGAARRVGAVERDLAD